MSQAAPQGHCYLAIGPNCWGRAETREKARRRAARCKPTWIERTRYNVIVAPRDSWVDNFGFIRWDHDHESCTVESCITNKGEER